MAFPVIVPRESEEMELCQVLQWHVKKGQRVKQGDILCEVDTGKATFDLEAPAEGVVLDIFFEENQEAPLLTPLAVVGEEGEEYEQFRPQIQEAKELDTEERKLRKGEAQGRKPDEHTLDRLRPGVRPFERKQLVSPRARRYALRNGIPLHRIAGSGPGGAVVERDVREWLQTLNQ
jgi:pyruvate dehydrogenase E2 component (dihydrolipoamide acetyltransferase)